VDLLIQLSKNNIIFEIILKNMLQTKQKNELFGVTYRDPKIRQKLLDIQYDLWKERQIKHSMEDVLQELIRSYEKYKQ